MKIKFTLLISFIFISFLLSAQAWRHPGIAKHLIWNMSSDQSLYEVQSGFSTTAVVGYYTDDGGSGKKTGFISMFSNNSGDTINNLPYVNPNENVLYSVAVWDGSPTTKTMINVPILSVGYQETSIGDKDMYVVYNDYSTYFPTKSVNEFVSIKPYNQEAKCIRQLGYNQNEYWISGYSENASGDKDYRLSRIDNSLYLSLDTIFGGTGDDVANSLIVTNNNSELLMGYTTSSPAIGKDFSSVLFVSSLDSIFYNRTFQRTGDQELFSSCKDFINQNIISVGYSDTTGSNKDFLIVCFDQYSGDTLWTRTLGTPYADEALSVTFVSFGGLDYGYAVAGYTTNPSGDKDNYMILFDTDGNAISQRTFGNVGVDECINTLFSDDCQYFFLGKSGSNQELTDCVLLDYNIGQTNVTCNGNADGTVNFADQSYMFSSNSTADLYDSGNNYITSGTDFSNLPSGKYYVDFSYFFGGAKSSCNMIDSITITEPSELTAIISSSDPDCMNNNGEISITSPTGGSYPYSIIWSTTETDVEQITGLGPGEYSVNITDYNGCVANYSAMLMSHFLPVIHGAGLIATDSIRFNHGKAILYKIGLTGTALELDSITSYNIDSINSYNFRNINPGDYKVFVQIDSTSHYPNYLDSYYSLNDTVITWLMGDTIYLTCDDTIKADVKMFHITPMESGVGSISGHIYLYTYTKQIGEPVPGAEILIEQEPNDVPVQATFTDNSGYYEVNGLEAGGLYSMEVDIPGYPMISSYVNIPVTTTDTVYEDMNFYIDTTINGGIMADTLQTNIFSFTNEKFELNAYPNPFCSNISFHFNLTKDAYVNADILNISGESVKNLLNEKRDKGNSIIVWQPQSALPSGIYFLRVQVDNNILIKKVLYNK